MTEYAIPKGVSLDTLRDLVAGWAAVGAGVEPRHTTDVEDETGVSDAAGRQNAFLEDIGVLSEASQQRHELTDRGAVLARALAKGDEETAREIAHDVLDDWPATHEIQGLVRGNPMSRDRLRPLAATATGHDVDAPRIRTGVNTLLDLLEWSGHLERDADDRYRAPGESEPEPPVAESTEPPADLESAVERVETTRAMEPGEPEPAVERVEPKRAVERVGESPDIEAPTTVRGESELPGMEAVAESDADLEPQTSAHAVETASHLPGPPAPDVPELGISVATETPGTGGAASESEAEESGASEAEESGKSEAEEPPAEQLEEAVEAGAEAELEAEAAEAAAQKSEPTEPPEGEAGASARTGDSWEDGAAGAPPGVEPDAAGETTEGTTASETDTDTESSEEATASEDEAGIGIPGGEALDAADGVRLSLEAEPEVEIEPGEDGTVRIELTARPEDLELGGGNELSISTGAEAPEGAAEGPASEAGADGAEAAGGEETGEEAGAAETDAESDGSAAGEPKAESGEAESGGAESGEAEGGEGESAGPAAEAGAGGETDGEAKGTEAEAAGGGDAGGAGGAGGGAGAGGAGSGLHTARPGEDTLGVALDLNLDADPEQVESLVRGLKQGLTEED